MSTDTTDLKQHMVEVHRDLRDRPAKRLIAAGVWMLAVGGGGALAILAAVLTDPRLRELRETINPAALTVMLLGGLMFGFGQWLRHSRIGQDENKEELRTEIRDARPADTEMIAQLVAMQEATQALIRKLEGEIAELMPLLRDAYEAGFRDGAEASSVANTNGAPRDGNVIPLPSQETRDALRRLARKTAQQPEDNSEDRRA